MFDHILHWTLQKGSHEFPGPDGGTCINEAAIVAAGFEYRAITSPMDMPRCFSRVIAQYALTLNDNMPDDQRQRLKPYILRLAGTADAPDVERLRAWYLAMQAVTVFAAQALDEAGLSEDAARCRAATMLEEAWTASGAAAGAAATTRTRAWAPMEVWAGQVAELAATKAQTAAVKAMVRPTDAAEAAAETAVSASAWDDALDALDGVLAIGRQAEPIDPPLAVERLERAKVPA